MIYESTVTKGLHHSKSKTRLKTHGCNTNDFTKMHLLPSLDYNKAKKTNRSKKQIAPNSSSGTYDYGLNTNLNKNTCKKGKQSCTTKNQIDHKVVCIYRAEVETRAVKSCYDNQVTSVHKASNKKGHNDNSFNANANDKANCKTNMEYDDMKNEIYDDANSENATTIYTNIDENLATEINVGDYSDYLSWKTCSCSSKTEEKQFVEACDMVFDKFTDILFDTVTSGNNVISQISSSVTFESVD